MSIDFVSDHQNSDNTNDHKWGNDSDEYTNDWTERYVWRTVCSERQEFVSTAKEFVSQKNLILVATDVVGFAQKARIRSLYPRDPMR